MQLPGEVVFYGYSKIEISRIFIKNFLLVLIANLEIF